MKRLIAALLILLGACGGALAQSACSYIYLGAVLTPAQWNACFSAKQDALNFLPVNKAGDSMAGRLATVASTTSVAGLNIASGTAPTSPVAGDLWATGSGLFGYFSGKTYLLSKTPANLVFTATSVNFNSAGSDTQIAISLPPGYTRYLVQSVRISNASTSLVAATAGLFTAAGATGIAVVTGGSAITVSSSLDANNNNSQSMTVNNANTESYTVSGQPILYFHIGTAEGAAATGDVTVTVAPLP